MSACKAHQGSTEVGVRWSQSSAWRYSAVTGTPQVAYAFSAPSPAGAGGPPHALMYMAQGSRGQRAHLSRYR